MKQNPIARHITRQKHFSTAFSWFMAAASIINLLILWFSFRMERLSILLLILAAVGLLLPALLGAGVARLTIHTMQSEGFELLRITPLSSRTIANGLIWGSLNYYRWLVGGALLLAADITVLLMLFQEAMIQAFGEGDTLVLVLPPEGKGVLLAFVLLYLLSIVFMLSLALLATTLNIYVALWWKKSIVTMLVLFPLLLLITVYGFLLLGDTVFDIFSEQDLHTHKPEYLRQSAQLLKVLLMLAVAVLPGFLILWMFQRKLMLMMSWIVLFASLFFITQLPPYSDYEFKLITDSLVLLMLFFFGAAFFHQLNVRSASSNT